MQPFLSVLIPCYNEEKTVEKVVQAVKNCNLDRTMEIILIDDASTDNTASVINGNLLDDIDHFIRLPVNRGKGYAIRQGIEKASGEYIIIQDADLEYDPGDFVKLCKPVLSGHADIVYGSRFSGGETHRVLYFWHSMGNKFLTLLSNVFTNLNLTDMETCYKLFPAKILKNLDLVEDRFGIEPEVTAKVARIADIRIYETGISYFGRTYAEGKKIGWRDGFRAIWVILKYGISR